MILDSFNKIWKEIEGENKSYTEILKSLRAEIAVRKDLCAELGLAQNQDDLNKIARITQEKETFIQVLYGLQNVPYLNLSKIEEPDAWKEALAKKTEILEKLKNKEVTL